jgi:ketosteroid isomerase-like protein
VTEPTTDGVALVEELSSRFLAGDRDGALRLYHPEIHIEQPASLPHGGRHVGASGMAEMAARFAEHWDRTIGPPRLHGCGNLVVQITSQTWTAKATGRAATVDVVELITLRDGLIAEIRVFQQDTHALLETLDRA